MPRVTQKEVATKVGVHPSTVSLALSGRSGIPEVTRRRVIKVAKALGYERDPMLGALAAYRKGLKSERVHGKVDQT
jgi:DNA-binding LacI/PurR family transcriptional regulator